MANKGTIFLDELGEMSTHLQPNLLHVLAGSSVFAAGRKALVDTVCEFWLHQRRWHESDETRFRETILQVERAVDTGATAARTNRGNSPLFRHFLDKYSEKFGKEVNGTFQVLLDCGVELPVPGNLGSLENFVKRYVILKTMKEVCRGWMEMSATRRELPAAGSDGAEKRG